MEKSITPVSSLATIGVMAAITCVIAPMALPIGPVPISLATLMLYLSPYVLGRRGSTLSCLVYLLLGLVGMPVFSGFTGGLGKLAGPTGGYLVGYLPLVIVVALAIHSSNRRIVHLIGMILGTTLLYAVGTVWFCYQSGTILSKALALCVYPFLIGDIIKIGIALTVGPVLRERLQKAGIATNV